jgi:hypothetical protein
MGRKLTHMTVSSAGEPEQVFVAGRNAKSITISGPDIEVILEKKGKRRFRQGAVVAKVRAQAGALTIAVTEED